MAQTHTPSNECERLQALQKLHILDTPNEPTFDELTRLAARLFDAPIAQIGLIDEHREWLKSCVGSSVRERPRDEAFCAHTILGTDPLIIEDTLADERFASIPQVREDGIRFYAGVPLATEDGHNVGALCVKDHAPRTVGQRDRETLFQLGRIASSLLEMRLAQLVREDADRLKDEFLATVSHELRTPMTSILGFAEILCGEVTPSERAEFSATLLASGRQLLDRLDDLLDLSRLRSGRSEIELARTPIEPLLNDIRALIQSEADRKSLALVVSIEPGAPRTIQTDARRLRQALINLVDNAVRFTDAGQIRLEARAHAPDQVAFTVVDTGIGIREAHHATIFEPFRQIDASAARRRDGFGLGLATVRQISEMLGGRIELDSAPGAGARFTLVLPLAPFDSETATIEAETSPDTTLRGRRLLVAVGSSGLRGAIGTHLRNAGAQVDQVANGSDALRALAPDHTPSIHYDAAIIDLGLSRLRGMDVVQTATARGCVTPMFAITSQNDAITRRMCECSSITERLLLPIDYHALIRRIALLPSRDQAAAA